MRRMQEPYENIEGKTRMFIGEVYSFLVSHFPRRLPSPSVLINCFAAAFMTSGRS